MNFGEYVLNLRVSKRLSLREVCKIALYDPSNWSKIERGVLAPPSDEETLQNWAAALELKEGTNEYQNFFDQAHYAKGLIPKDIFANKHVMESVVPELFRTLRADPNAWVKKKSARDKKSNESK